MRILKSTLIAVGTVAILTVIATFMNSTQAEAQNPHPGSAPVNIVAPLPLPVSGTVSGTVQVGNLPTRLQVTEVVAEPINFQGQCTSDAAGCSVSYQVPANRRVVIEYASIRAVGLPPGVPVEFHLQTFLAGSSVEHQI